jgi:hypothetical protein
MKLESKNPNGDPLSCPESLSVRRSDLHVSRSHQPPLAYRHLLPTGTSAMAAHPHSSAAPATLSELVDHIAIGAFLHVRNAIMIKEHTIAGQHPVATQAVELEAEFRASQAFELEAEYRALSLLDKWFRCGLSGSTGKQVAGEFGYPSGQPGMSWTNEVMRKVASSSACKPLKLVQLRILTVANVPVSPCGSWGALSTEWQRASFLGTPGSAATVSISLPSGSSTCRGPSCQQRRLISCLAKNSILGCTPSDPGYTTSGAIQTWNGRRTSAVWMPASILHMPRRQHFAWLRHCSPRLNTAAGLNLPALHTSARLQPQNSTWSLILLGISKVSM